MKHSNVIDSLKKIVFKPKDYDNVEVKSVLWTFAMIGRSKYGIQILKEHQII